MILLSVAMCASWKRNVTKETRCLFFKEPNYDAAVNPRENILSLVLISGDIIQDRSEVDSACVLNDSPCSSEDCLPGSVSHALNTLRIKEQ